MTIQRLIYWISILKISIITALYNAEKTIEQTMLSVKGQTYQNIEHIIIDGRSTDQSLAVLNKFATPNTKIISEEDAGIYDALNKGIAHAQGDVIGFVHSDDFLADDQALEKIARAFEKHQAEAVFSDLDYVSKNKPKYIIRHWKSGVFSPHKLKRGWMPPHPTLYLKKSVFERYGSFNTAYKVSADYDFILRYLTQTSGQIAYIPETLYKMRTGGMSTTKLFQKMTEDYIALRNNNVGGLQALLYKNLSKFPQLFCHST